MRGSGARWAACALVATAGGTAEAQSVRARVVAEATRSPVAEAAVRVVSERGDTVLAGTGRDGFFTVAPGGPGRYRIAIEHTAFSALDTTIEVRHATGERALPAFVLREAVIALDSLEVKARASRDAVAGMSRASYVVAGARMARFEALGTRPLSVIREISGLRVRNLRDYVCIEALRRTNTLKFPPPPCEPVMLYVDGIRSGDPWEGLRSLDLVDGGEHRVRAARGGGVPLRVGLGFPGVEGNWQPSRLGRELFRSPPSGAARPVAGKLAIGANRTRLLSR